METLSWPRQRTSITDAFLVLTVGFLTAPHPAFAVDGVVEINQARALAGQVTTGDTPGFPVTISEPGSYRLTGNLTVPNVFSPVIDITSDDVTIDLNGFTASGPVTCSGEGSAISCSPTGSWNGIDGNFHSRTVVRNGTVRGFGGTGILLGDYARVEHVTVTWNTGNGVSAGIRSIIDYVTSSTNGFNGIHLDRLPRVLTTAVTANGSHGLLCGDGCLVRDTVAKLNGANGIHLSNYGTVTGSLAESNEGAGIVVSKNSIVSFSAANLNASSQISASSGCLITHNTVRNATGSTWGLSLHASAGYSNNVIFAPDSGHVQNGVNLGHNLCTGVLCP